MSKLDEVKESIGYLKVIFSILIAINISLVVWLYQDTAKVTLIDMVALFSLAILISVAIIYINRKILIKIRSLRDL